MQNASAKTKILVSGGTGFVGRTLTRHLQHEGPYDVHRLVRSRQEGAGITDWIIGDVSLSEIFERNRFDVIVHLAVEYGQNGLNELVRCNIELPVQLLRLAAKHGASLFINTDSFYTKFEKIEAGKMDYLLSKKAFALWLEACRDEIEIVSARLEHVYGPKDNPNKFVPWFIRQLFEPSGRTIDLTPGEQKRDFIHVEDVVTAYEALIRNRSGRPGYASVDVGTGKTTSLRSFLELIRDQSNSSAELNFGGRPYPDNEIMLSCAETSYLRTLGWAPQHSLESGVKTLFS